MEFVLTNLSSNSNRSRAGQLSNIETYNGYVEKLSDAIIIIEAIKNNILNQRLVRLTSKEHNLIQSGTVVVWEENISQIVRWTDGRSWSASRLHEDFLVYHQLSSKPKKITGAPYEKTSNKIMEGGLIKKSISISDKNKRFHLINYYHQKDVDSRKLKLPSQDPLLKSIKVVQTNYIYYNHSPDKKKPYRHTFYEKTQHNPEDSILSLNKIVSDPTPLGDFKSEKANELSRILLPVTPNRKEFLLNPLNDNNYFINYQNSPNEKIIPPLNPFLSKISGSNFIPDLGQSEDQRQINLLNTKFS